MNFGNSLTGVRPPRGNKATSNTPNGPNTNPYMNESASPR